MAFKKKEWKKFKWVKPNQIPGPTNQVNGLIPSLKSSQ